MYNVVYMQYMRKVNLPFLWANEYPQIYEKYF